MLTLSSISQRIEQLEEAEYSSVNERLSTWRNMVAWQYWLASLPDRDNWRKAFNELPLNHPVRELAGRLTWLECQLSPVLTARRDGFWSERVYIALDLLFTDMLDSGYSQDEISTIEAMNEGLTIVNVLLDNDELWQGFYEGKRQENERHELMLKYRGLAHTSQLTLEAIEWLKTFDAAFWENHIKKQSEVKPEVKPITTQVIPQAIPEAIPPQETIQPITDGPVRLRYIGGWRGFQVTTVDGIKSIEPGDTVTVPPFVWSNIQNGNMPKSWWVKL